MAEDVLEAARLHAPPTLEETSSLYWYSGHGYGGHSANAFAGIEQALTGAFAHPGSSGGGGRLLRRRGRRRRRRRRRGLVEPGARGFR